MRRDQWMVIVLATTVLAVGVAGQGGVSPSDVKLYDSTPTPYLGLTITGMEGVSQVYVVVGELNEEWAKAVGLTQSEVQTHVELYLRRIPGLRVVDHPVVVEAYLSVGIAGLLQHMGDTTVGYACDVQLSLGRDVFVRDWREGGWRHHLCAPTWHTHQLLSGPREIGQGKRVKDRLTVLLDDFQNEYLKANPRVKATAE